MVPQVVFSFSDSLPPALLIVYFIGEKMPRCRWNLPSMLMKIKFHQHPIRIPSACNSNRMPMEFRSFAMRWQSVCCKWGVRSVFRPLTYCIFLFFLHFRSRLFSSFTCVGPHPFPDRQPVGRLRLPKRPQTTDSPSHTGHQVCFFNPFPTARNTQPLNFRCFSLSFLAFCRKRKIAARRF